VLTRCCHPAAVRAVASRAMVSNAWVSGALVSRAWVSGAWVSGAWVLGARVSGARVSRARVSRVSSMAPGSAVGRHGLGDHDPRRTRRGWCRLHLELTGRGVTVDEDLLEQAGVDVEDEPADQVVMQQER